MIAIDTNVVVRLLTQDDAAQARRAQRLLEENEILLAITVILESEWVLRRLYGFGAALVIERLEAFVSLPSVRLENGQQLAAAFALAKSGVDLADALHLSSASGCEAFVTFDSDLRKAAARAGAIPIRAP